MVREELVSMDGGSEEARIKGDGRRRERIWIGCGFGWSDAANKGRREAGCDLVGRR